MTKNVGNFIGTSFQPSTSKTSAICNLFDLIRFRRNEQWPGGTLNATGGTISTVGFYKIHTFTSPGTFTVNSGNTNVEYLVVAGGGGGYNAIGNQNSGGGGAGGLRSNHPGMPAPLKADVLFLGAGSYSITVGAGGNSGQFTPGNSDIAGTRGGDSSFGGIVANGGGTTPPASGPGGSGAGGFAFSAPPTNEGTGNSPPTTPPQGNPGGAGNNFNNSSGSGGGGAGGRGNDASGTGIGGTGISLDFPGAAGVTTYSKGGNGSSRGLDTLVPGTGQGGGSTYGNLPAVQNGAPGIVIIRYRT